MPKCVVCNNKHGAFMETITGQHICFRVECIIKFKETLKNVSPYKIKEGWFFGKKQKCIHGV